MWRLLHLPQNTHCDLLPYTRNDISLSQQIYRRVISFFRGLHNSTNSITAICYKLVMCGSQSAVSNSTSMMPSHYKLTGMMYIWYEITTTTFTELMNPIWSASIIRDLLDIRFNMPTRVQSRITTVFIICQWFHQCFTCTACNSLQKSNLLRWKLCK